MSRREIGCSERSRMRGFNGSSNSVTLGFIAPHGPIAGNLARPKQRFIIDFGRISDSGARVESPRPVESNKIESDEHGGSQNDSDRKPWTGVPRRSDGGGRGRALLFRRAGADGA